MKNVYMVQASTTYGGERFKAAYLPYATGLLVAAAWENETVRKEYEFKRFIFTRENTDDAVASLENPSVIGFSNYVWNTEYNKVLAAKVKAAYPDCVIIFGGHNVPPDTSMLSQNDYIDLLIHGEGEEAFKNILIALCEDKPDFSAIANVSYRSEGGFVSNPVEILTRLDYPSPYLTGVFDDIIASHPDMQLDAIIETSRGCPRGCAYCDWGCTSSRIKLFPIERVYDEIDWFAEHKTAFIWGADANFGEFDRDEDIVDKFIEVREKTGYPERIRINYAKDKDERVFAISRKFEKYGLSKEGATLSFQSMNPQVLKAIGRHNMSLEHFENLIAMYKREGVTTYSELILGLPCETYESFCRGIGILLEAGQHRLIAVYNCVLLPNSPLAGSEYMNKYGIRTADVLYLTAHSADSQEVAERTRYIVGTDAMYGDAWIEANIFNCFVQSAHHYGLLLYFALYLYFVKQMPYEEFYKGLVSRGRQNPDSIVGKAYGFLYNYYGAMEKEKPMELYRNDIYGDISWSNDRILQLEASYRLDEFYAEMREYFIECGIDAATVDTLVRYQKCCLKQPGKNHFSEEFDDDWGSFFDGAYRMNKAELTHRKIRVCVDNESNPADWPEFALEAIWFGKNGAAFNPGIRIETVE